MEGIGALIILIIGGIALVVFGGLFGKLLELIMDAFDFLIDGMFSGCGGCIGRIFAFIVIVLIITAVLGLW